jgi:hypothetical protein
MNVISDISDVASRFAPPHPADDKPRLNYPALRAFTHIYAPIAERQWIGAQADAGFDGGEWSGPAHSRILERIEQRIARDVAARFDMTGQELLRQWNIYTYYEADRWMAAQFRTISMDMDYSHLAKK